MIHAKAKLKSQDGVSIVSNPRVYIVAAGNERGGASAHLTSLAHAVLRRGLEERFSFLLVGEGHLSEALVNYPNVTILPSHPLKAVRALRRMISQANEPVILHSHGPRLNVLCLRSRSIARLWVATLHSHIGKDFLAQRWKTFLFTRMNRFALARTDGLFVVNRSFTELFPRKTCLFVPNGVEIQPLTQEIAYYREALRSRLGLGSDAVVVGVAARLDPVKDVATLIRAIAHLGERNVHVAIAGDGTERQVLEQLTRERKLEDRVHFLGYESNVAAFYAGLDIHILTSLSEGMPSALLEAGAYGVPNVGTNIPGITQLLTDKVTGRLFRVGDDVELASVIDELLFKPEAARAMAEAFSRQVLPRFQPDTMLTAYLDGYRKISGAQWITGSKTEPDVHEDP